MAEVTQVELPDAVVIFKKTQKDLENFVLSFAEDAVTKHYRNGYIVHVHFRNGKILTKTADMLLQYFQESDCNYVINKAAAKSSVHNLLSKLKRHKQNVSRDWHLIEDLLLQPVHVPVSTKRKLPPEIIQSGDNIEAPVLNSPPIKILSTDCGECPSLRDKSQNYIADKLGDTSKKAGQQQQSAHPHQSTEKQLKTDCAKCSTMRKSYSQAISELRVKLRASRKRLQEISKTYNIRVINQTLKRKDAARQRLICERKALRKENSTLKNEIKRLKSVVLQRIFKSDKSDTYTYKIGDDLSQINLELEINNITKEIKSREERIQELGLEVDSLRCELNKLQQCSITAMEITPGDSRLNRHSQRCDEDVTMMPKYVDRSVGKVPRFKQGEGTSKKRWIEVEKCTDIPANVAIEIEDQTNITCLDNGALELWNHKSSGEVGATDPADIFSTVKIEISKLAFKSVNGKYWSLQTDGRVVSTAETIGDREHFEPVFKDGKVAFIGYNNCFLSHNDDGDIVCLSSSADPKIWFKLLKSNVARMNDPLRKLKLKDVQVTK